MTTTEKRFRLAISDGLHIHKWALISEELNHLVNEMPEFTIIKVKKYITPEDNKKENDMRYILYCNFFFAIKCQESQIIHKHIDRFYNSFLILFPANV